MYVPGSDTQCFVLPLLKGKVNFFAFESFGSEYSTTVSWEDMKVTENPVCWKGGNSARSEVTEIL